MLLVVPTFDAYKLKCDIKVTNKTILKKLCKLNGVKFIFHIQTMEMGWFKACLGKI